MPGYIKLYRDIQEHWSWKDKPFTKGQAWIDIIFRCNHVCKKVPRGSGFVWVLRGQFIFSNYKLAEAWGWSESSVRLFLKLLQEDGMLIIRSQNKYTLYEVVNYCAYQSAEWWDFAPGHNAQKTRKKRANNAHAAPNNNDKNDKNENNISKGLDLFSPDVALKITEWITYKSERKDGYKETGLRNLLSQIKKQIDTHGEQKVINLITECMASGWKGIIWDKLAQPARPPNRRDNFEQRTYGNDFFDMIENAALRNHRDDPTA